MLVDKPAGLTSHDVVATVRRRFRTRAVGHTGTLDPFATGLLVLVLGSATRVARFVEQGDKTYLATARLGHETATDDGTGEATGPSWTGEWPPVDAVMAALVEATEWAVQRPPAYSAKHVDGERSYRKARRGELVELPAVPVRIDRLELVEYRPPDLVFRATVGPGAYLRAIGRDLGRALGTGAHLTALRRERVGRFSVEDALPVDRLTGDEPLIPAAALVGELPRLDLDPEQCRAIRHGRAIEAGVPPADRALAALLVGDALVAVAEGRMGRWQPIVVLAEQSA